MLYLRKRALEVFHKRKRIRKNNVNATQKRSESIDGIELYRCRSCNFSTTSENGIQIHLAKHKERRVLSRSSVRKMGLENEEKETEIHCPACTFSTFDKEEMISHFTGHESQVSCLTEKSGFYQCCHCNFRTKVKLEMENHLLTQANNRRHFINGVTYVPLKSKNCGCSSNISKFQKSSVGPIKSREGLYKTPEYLVNQEETKIKKCVYNCSLCAFYNISKYEMVKHMEKHYAELEDATQVFHPHLKMESFQCCHCEFKTTMQSEIENHLLSEEDNKSHLDINLSYPNKFFVCDFCNTKFEDIETLEIHRQYIHIDPIDWQ